MGRDAADRSRHHSGGPGESAQQHLSRRGSSVVKAWLLLALIVFSTAAADVLQSFEMRRHGESHDFGPRGLRQLAGTFARKKYLILAGLSMARSFFSFINLDLAS